MPMGEISKTEHGCTVYVKYDLDTKVMGKNARGEAITMYKCYPRVTGNYTKQQELACANCKSIIAYPATILKQIINA